MSEYDRIDVSEGIYMNKTNISKTLIFVITDNFQIKVQRKIEREQVINIENYLANKKIKRENGRNRYHNMSEENKQKFKKYYKDYREAKNQYKNFFSLFLCIT